MSRLRRPWLADAVIVLVFAVGGSVDVLARGYTSGPAWANVAGCLALAAALLVRRRSPLAAALAYGATLIVFGLYLTPPSEMLVSMPGFLVAAYAASRYDDLLRPALVVASVPATIITVDLIIGEHQLLGDAAFPTAIATAFFLVGRTLRSRAALAVELHEAALRAQEEREAEAERAVAEERRRIAREMHDVVAHSISVMVVQAGGARRILDQEPDRAVAAAAQIERTGREALAEMRRLLGVLHAGESSAELAPQPGMASLEALVDRARAAGLPVELEVTGVPRPLPTGIDLSGYRIVQEALTNAIRYAAGAPTDVHVHWGPDALELEVSDRGPGPAVAQANGGGEGGHGLIGMQERVRLYGGELEAGRHRGGGFRVRARIPFAVEEAA